MVSLTGKVALVTGGGSGIGRAAALAFADAGSRVVVVDIDKKSGHDVVDTIKERGFEADFFSADVSRATDVETVVGRTVETFGRLDCAFNNAGIEGSFELITDLAEENWDRVLAVNLTGVWLCMKYEILEMLKQGGGNIVNMSSSAGLRGIAAGGAYAASKHGVIGLTKTAALEYAQRGIRVNAVCPGVIQTPLADRVEGKFPGMKGNYLNENPLGRVGTAEEIANAVVWLCSNLASYVNGQAISLDGGLSAK